jgi:hypothetical protein
MAMAQNDNPAHYAKNALLRENLAQMILRFRRRKGKASDSAEEKRPPSPALCAPVTSF